MIKKVVVDLEKLNYTHANISIFFIIIIIIFVWSLSLLSNDVCPAYFFFFPKNEYTYANFLIKIKANFKRASG